jgi:hypothetical protein
LLHILVFEISIAFIFDSLLKDVVCFPTHRSLLLES